MHPIPHQPKPPLSAEEWFNMLVWIAGSAAAYLALGLFCAQWVDGRYLSAAAFVFGPLLLLALSIVAFCFFQIVVFVAESRNGYTRD